MNYWIENIFKDSSLWTKILIPGVGFLLFLDIVSYIVNRPGYFHLWPLKIAVLIGIPYIIRVIYKNFQTLNKIKKVEMEAPVIERNREKEIIEIIRTEPDCATFCFECTYFDENLKACRRDRLYERVREISIGNRKYCLYWEKMK